MGKWNLPIEERLAARTVKMESGCWEWLGALDTGGYGIIRVGRERKATHRLSFFLANGFWPKVCRHTCDNPKCINPEHLLDGSTRENMMDAIERGRIGKKYTTEQVEKVREMRAEGFLYREISSEVGVSQAQISRILNGKQRTIR